ncbi:MAG: competence/damage-inducible protein A [Flavobacteriales bacterium]|nr:competence/damage-inducible protein A [Flavobacteriales bacterium]
MKAEIITIGDEILIGQIVDTNSAWMADRLESSGVKVVQVTTISDNEVSILNALEGAKSRADIVLMTGGLGPTNDDITKLALCKYFQSNLEISNTVLQDVEAVFSRFNSVVSDINKQQAEVPSNCTVIRNPNGTAPGMWFDEDNTIYVSMPGVPHEMKVMIDKSIIPMLKEKYTLPVIIHKTILTHGIGESRLAEMMEDWEASLADTQIKLAYLPAPGMVRLRLSGSDAEQIENKLQQLLPIIKEHVFGFGKETLESVVIDLLRKNKKTVSTAESCTGGYTSHLITSVAGSSEVYVGSVVAYKNDVKERILNVDPEIINQHGAVSKEVAELMALGIKNKMDSDYSISTTGIAGPSGGTEEKPVGTVWIAIAFEDTVISKTFKFGDNRERNIRRSALAALDMLRRELLSV